ncbi:hypothetical protein CROQUDRAFT_713722 [Cronartium quercuum f. sp. fusiforme G11]|uniref:Zn(2)-C6 fungal-type domain-containing protein n=1 Tax=Cronartium quercuum f. sp. fusiforme G11 TaxID=708437 RepID=A0A9P6NT94_9BASI|nr:hypothetical protein CROQUDRAFT_713722 [Cronartium quercuum f. sp. fusiforme G11]
MAGYPYSNLTSLMAKKFPGSNSSNVSSNQLTIASSATPSHKDLPLPLPSPLEHSQSIIPPTFATTPSRLAHRMLYKPEVPGTGTPIIPIWACPDAEPDQDPEPPVPNAGRTYPARCDAGPPYPSTSHHKARPSPSPDVSVSEAPRLYSDRSDPCPYPSTSTSHQDPLPPLSDLPPPKKGTFTLPGIKEILAGLDVPPLEPLSSPQPSQRSKRTRTYLSTANQQPRRRRAGLGPNPTPLLATGPIPGSLLQSPRQRVSVACTFCRTRKLRCTPGPGPCEHCSRRGHECVFDSSSSTKN